MARKGTYRFVHRPALGVRSELLRVVVHATPSRKVISRVFRTRIMIPQLKVAKEVGLCDLDKDPIIAKVLKFV